MDIRGFETFEGIINGTDIKAKLKWAQRYRRAILNEVNPATGENVYKDGYYSVLLEEYKFVDSQTIEFEGKKNNFMSHICYYKSPNHRIAQVVTYPRETTSIEGDPLTTKERGEVGVATYCLNDRDEVVIVNRFDAIGFQYHDNDYSMYGSLANTYERYFTDGYYAFPISDVATMVKPYAKLPHFHFQSPDQTQAMGQEKCNAISVDNLLAYLDALQQGKDPVIQSNSLGMPFLSYFKNEKEYHSTMEAFLVEARDALIEKGDSCDIPIINFMQQLISSYDFDDDKDKIDESFTMPDSTKFISYTSSTIPAYNTFFLDSGFQTFVPIAGTPEGFENIRAIQKDLEVAKAVIARCEDRPEFVAAIANTFMESLNNPTQQASNMGDRSYEML